MAGVFIDAELASFLEVGNSVLVATRNSSLIPCSARGVGVRVLAPDRIAVFLPKATSAGLFANIEENRILAVCVCSPKNFRTVQLKGRVAATTDCTPDDLDLCEQQMRGFGDAVLQYGNTRKQVRNLWRFDAVRVEVQLTAAYLQTPGPGAGAALDGRRE